jgi:hypothetical protein
LAPLPDETRRTEVITQMTPTGGIGGWIEVKLPGRVVSVIVPLSVPGLPGNRSSRPRKGPLGDRNPHQMRAILRSQ